MSKNLLQLPTYSRGNQPSWGTLSQDWLQKHEAAWCRAYQRGEWFPRGCHVIVGASRLLRAVGAAARLDFDPASMHVAFCGDPEGAKLRVGLNSFRNLFNGEVKPAAGKSAEQWYRRVRICLRILLEGNTRQKMSPRGATVARRIQDFFLPNRTLSALRKDQEWYFYRKHEGAMMPMNVCEVVAELRAMCFFAGRELASRCLVVRASGWQEFPVRRRLFPLTRELLERGVQNYFIVPQLNGLESDAEKSTLVIHNLVQKGAGRTAEAILQAMRVVRTPATAVESPDGRPVNFLSSFFRWAYYCCPRSLTDPTPVHSLVVVRSIADPGTPFSFCPTDQEARDFRDWFKMIIADARPS